MRTWKKLFALILAFTMVLNLNVMNLYAQEEVSIEIDANGGTFSCTTNQGDAWTAEYDYFWLTKGEALGESGLTISEPVFWDTERQFEGWMILVNREMTDEWGETYQEWVQLEDTDLMTSAELLEFTFDEDALIVAQWEGNDEDYYSEVSFNGCGGYVSVKYWDYEFEEDAYYTTDEWGMFQLKEGISVEEQPESTWSEFLGNDPEKDGTTFEGWLEFTYEYLEEEDKNVYTLVSDTLYTTEEVKNRPVPKYNVIYAAKWADRPVEDYFYNGASANFYIQSNGGKFHVKSYDGSYETETWYASAKVGYPLSNCILELSDPVFWTTENEFAGWTIEKWTHILDEDGEIIDCEWSEDEKLYTTEELLAYEVEENVESFTVKAQWTHEYKDFYSTVAFDCYEEFAYFEIEETYNVDGEIYSDVYKPNGWNFELKEDGKTIKESIKNVDDYSYVIISDPVREEGDANFEGWLKYAVHMTEKQYEDGNIFYSYNYELLSEKLYTTSEILNEKVPEDDIYYAAKWSDKEIADYFPETKETLLYTKDDDLVILYEDEGEEYKTYTIYQEVESGKTLNAAWEEQHEKVTMNEPKCRVLEGWTLYTYDNFGYFYRQIPDGEFPEDTEEKIHVLVHVDEEYEEYVVLYNPTKSGQVLSTEELFNLKIENNILAVANWKENHKGGDTVIENYVAPTDTTSGSQDKVVYCTECGEEISRTTEILSALKNPFTDVKETEYYYNPVLWAVENGITEGTTPTTFGPDKNCTRGQVVTFLWRANGEQKVTSSENPFTDVKEDDYYYNAVLWAVENGITEGTSATKFSPEDTCTRAQVATFLYRAAKEPEPKSNDNPFIDVKKEDYYYNAVLWAVENEITKGTSATKFSPEDTCTRGQVVTFLYRAQ